MKTMTIARLAFTPAVVAGLALYLAAYDAVEPIAMVESATATSARIVSRWGSSRTRAALSAPAR